MATIADIARHADVSVESVLRVLNREPVSEDVTGRVLAAMDFHGFPRRAVTPPAVESAVERVGEELRERLARTAAELETSLPRGVGSVVYEALRVEVRPVADHVGELGAVLERVVGRLERLEAELARERQARLEDVGLLVDLLTTGWQTVDRRLGRVERILRRLEDGRPERAEAAIVRMDRHERRQSSSSA